MMNESMKSLDITISFESLATARRSAGLLSLVSGMNPEILH